jgi:hypothetical protein
VDVVTTSLNNGLSERLSATIDESALGRLVTDTEGH